MIESREPVQTLARVLRNVLGDVAAIDDWRLLGGGVGHRTYAIAAGGERYVVRLGRGLAGNVLDLDAERDLMCRVAAAGLAPAVLGADAASGALVTAYLAQARPWTAQSSRRQENIGRAAALLKALHGLPVTVRDFEPVSFARAYLGEAQNIGRFDDEDQRLAGELLALAGGYEQRYDNAVLCHNDLVAANILDSGELALVDFEYAVLAAPVLDLASLAAMNAFDGRRRRALVEAYYSAGRAPFSEAEFAKVVRMVRLMSYFWALAQDDGDRAKLADFNDRSELKLE